MSIEDSNINLGSKGEINILITIFYDIFISTVEFYLMIHLIYSQASFCVYSALLFSSHPPAFPVSDHTCTFFSVCVCSVVIFLVAAFLIHWVLGFFIYGCISSIVEEADFKCWSETIKTNVVTSHQLTELTSFKQGHKLACIEYQRVQHFSVWVSVVIGN